MRSLHICQVGCVMQIVQLMEDKDALLAQQARDTGTPGDIRLSQQKVLQIKGNVMNRILKYANEAVLSMEEIKSMDDATFLASLHSSDDIHQ